MSDEAIALAFRTGLPFVGLRDHEHDPEVDHLVPPDAARSARVIPLTVAEDHVRLAVADPEPDLAALTPYLEGRRVELAIAPREELEEILGPPPPEPEAAAPAVVEPAPFEPGDVEQEAVAAEPAAPTDGIEEEAPAAAAAAEHEAPGAAQPAEAEPAAAPTDGIEAPDTGAPQTAEHEAPAAAEPEAPAAEPEAPAAEPEAPAAEHEATAAAEPEAPAAEEPQAPAAEPAAAEPAAAAEAAPQAAAEAPVVEHYAFAPTEAPGDAPSWLAPPPKRRWLRTIGRFLLYVLVLAAACGAVAAYLLTR